VNGTTLVRLRRRLGLSQAKLARLLAVSPNSVARWERDELPIRPPMARLILLVAHLAEQGDEYAEELVRLGRKSDLRDGRR
jgi:transcriptional regulator with XRE-family HTH domain